MIIKTKSQVPLICWLLVGQEVRWTWLFILTLFNLEKGTYWMQVLHLLIIYVLKPSEITTI